MDIRSAVESGNIKSDKKIKVLISVKIEELNINSLVGKYDLENYVFALMNYEKNVLNVYIKTNFKVSDYHQHSRGSGSDAAAIAYIEIQNNKISDWGAGIDQNTTVASYKAILNCINKILS